MAKKTKSQKKIHTNNPLVFLSNASIGNLDAESDNNFLSEAFINKEESTLVSDIEDPRCILIGRTGSGKTAIIKHLEQSNIDFKIVRIEPEAMALTYLSNSTILSYFEKLGIKMELFYKTLWKHVFIIEFLKLYSGSDQSKIDNLFAWFRDKFNGREQSKKRAFDYLSNWKDSFWQNTEFKIKEMENNVASKLSEKLNIKTQQLLPLLAEIDNTTESSQSQHTKTEVINKSQLVVNELQIQEINEVIKAMKNDLFDKRKAWFFILIDDLDKEWVDNKIVYDLLKNMIEAIKELRIIEGTKIVIALRENLLRLVIDKSKARGFQREKVESLFLNIKWSESELRALIEKRLSHLFKGKYGKREVRIEDVMRITNDKTVSALPYILERTLMRPRDVIDFVNKCIAEANGKNMITGDMIRLAEVKYSTNRLKAVEDEWRENYPYIFDCLQFLRGINESFKLNKAQETLEEYLSSGQRDILNEESETAIGKAVKEYTDHLKAMPLLRIMLITLYEVGVIGVKLTAGTSTSYSYINYSIFQPEQINDGTTFIVHKAFHKALQINTNLRNNS